MKYLRLFEEHTENLNVLLSTITEDNYEKVLDYIGLDNDNYEIKSAYYDRNFKNNMMINDSEITILMNSKELEDIMDVEEGIIFYLLQFLSYNNYEYYVDDDEFNYLHFYLSGNTFNEIKILAETFDFEIDPEEEGAIHDLFIELGLKQDLKDIKNEIEMENERAVEKAAKHIIELLPFSVKEGSDRNKNMEITFNYQEVIDYIKKYNLKVKTFKDLLENIYDSDEFSYDFEYGDIKNDYLGDFEEVDQKISNVCVNYINCPDEIFVKLIQIDNLELFKNKLKLANFENKYDVYLEYERKKYNLFELAIKFNGTILQWFKSFEFQEWFIENYSYYADTEPRTNAYKLLKSSNIVNSKIEDEYDYLIDSEKYNL